VSKEVMNNMKNNVTFAKKSETDNTLINREKYIKEARTKYESYSTDEWTKVVFDVQSGGFNVYHKRHNFSKAGGGGKAEKDVGKILAKIGKQVEFLPEKDKDPDIIFDGQTWDIKYIEAANVQTIRNHIKDARKADNAIFYWEANNKLIELNNAVKREVGRFNNGQISYLPNIGSM